MFERSPEMVAMEEIKSLSPERFAAISFDIIAILGSTWLSSMPGNESSYGEDE